MTGPDIRAARARLGMTQAALSQALGVTSTTIARWERGEIVPDHPEMIRLAIDRLISMDQEK